MDVVFRILLILLLPLGSLANSSSDILIGTVKDSNSNEALSYASVQLFTKTDSILLEACYTDIEGNYTFKKIKKGNYRLVASYMGYEDSQVFLEIDTKKIEHNFKLRPKSFALSEIEIIAEKTMVENSLEKTTINVEKNTTLTGGTAQELMQSLPSVDIDIDGKIHYRGSEKVIILLNGAKSELVKSLDQIPVDQIQKIEIINNPSAKYDAEGMSGIINIVMKKGLSGKRKTTLMVKAGYPETLGGNIGYNGNKSKTTFYINAGINHLTKFQTKEHLRKNYEDPTAFNYHQFDRQDEIRNDAIVNAGFAYKINKKQNIDLSLLSGKKFNSADRSIDYSTLDKSGVSLSESIKDLDISLDNYTLDSKLNYSYQDEKGQYLKARFNYSLFDQINEMNNTYFPSPDENITERQNTYSKQLNKEYGISIDHLVNLSRSFNLETGLQYSLKDLLNDFSSEFYNPEISKWENELALANKFNYIQQINAAYLNLVYEKGPIAFQAGIRSEQSKTSQNGAKKRKYLDFFPSAIVSGKLSENINIFSAYTRRINRPSIKMLNPFTDEYADLLNRHTGNPDLLPEYVNSFEIGSRLFYEKWSGQGSFYYRDIDQAISRIKSAANDSALVVTFMNLDGADLLGSELSFNYHATKWWSINCSFNIFHTSLSGSWENNEINRDHTAWNFNLSNTFKLPYEFGFQFMAYFRSKLPSVMGIYKERYYADMALSKKIMKGKGHLVLKISDVFNTYRYGLDLDAIDENYYRYSQRNRRKNESQYFVLSFIYNIKGKEKKQKKENYFLEGFDK